MDRSMLVQGPSEGVVAGAESQRVAERAVRDQCQHGQDNAGADGADNRVQSRQETLGAAEREREAAGADPAQDPEQHGTAEIAEIERR